MRRLLVLVATAALLVGGGGTTAGAEAPPAPTSPGSLGPAPSHEYVQAVHRLFLGRYASGVEARALVDVVHHAGPHGVTTRLALSPEWAGVRIDELYRRILGRAADQDGRAHWLRSLAAGTTLESVAAGFYGSEEYFGAVGRRHDRYVDSLYRTLLRREPDPGGRDGWVRQLDGGASRTQVAVAFYGSVESRRQRVDGLYREVLGRPPDTGGRDFWVGRVPELGDVALAAHLASSDELHGSAAGGVPFATVTVEPVGPGTALPLSASWRSGCPVGPGDLRGLRFPHFRPDGSRSTGVLVVHRDVVDDVIVLLRTAHGMRFPITQARPIDDFDGDDDASMAADNTSAFNCRRVAGTSTWSEHAYGRAIDVNPVANPYVRGDRVDPPAGRHYLDRNHVRPGMLVEGSAVIAAVDRIGWGWGGRWRSASDFQHLSRSGR